MSEEQKLGCKVTYLIKRELGGFFSKSRATGIFPKEIAMNPSCFGEDVEVVEVSEPFLVSKFNDGLSELMTKNPRDRVVGIQPPECVVYLRNFNYADEFRAEDKKEFLNSVENFAMYHYNYVANKEPGPYQSSFDFKIHLLKLLHATPPFEGLSLLIDYVKHIPYIALRRL